MDIVYHPDQYFIEQLQQNCGQITFDHIYDVYWKPLFQYAYKRLQSEDAAKDMIQDIFISLWNKRETLKLTSSLSAYLFSMLRFKLIDCYRAGEARKLYVLNTDRSEYAFENHTDQRVHQNEINSLLNTATQKLPHKMKEIFELSRLKGYSTRQIAEQMSISEQTVKNQLSTALRRLRLSFTDYLVIAAMFFFIR